MQYPRNFRKLEFLYHRVGKFGVFRGGHLLVTYEIAERLETFVKLPSGEGLNVFEIVEKGDFSPLKRIKTLVATAFYMAYDDIMRLFDQENFDRENEIWYASNPERKNENREQKAFRWFSSATDGETLENLADAVPQAILNFTLSRDRREALSKILAAENELETEIIQQGVEKFLAEAENIRENIGNLLDQTLSPRERPEN